YPWLQSKLRLLVIRQSTSGQPDRPLRRQPEQLLPRLVRSERQPATAFRKLVGTSIAAMPEEGSSILSGDAVERGSQRLFKSLDGPRGDAAQIGLHLGPTGFDRAEVGAVGGQIAIRKA